MTRLISPDLAAAPDAGERRRPGDPAPTWARLLGLGCAAPELCSPQRQVAEELARAWRLEGRALERWRRIIDGSQIDARHAVAPIASSLGLTTRARMEAYARLAPPLAAAAARKALRSAGVAMGEVTDLIVVSCTGFSAPGVDVELIERLGLAPTVRRTMVGFMGCFGAISGLRTAVGAVSANPDAVALVVCVELCSLHVRPEPDVQNQVASALFADGAAAAVIAGDRPRARCVEHVRRDSEGRRRLRVTTGASRVLPQGRDWMTWRITDAGFAMTLTREVPAALRAALADFAAGAAPGGAARAFAIHPGGAAILDAADEALGCRGGRGVAEARRVLRRFGNMSSPTVLFVLRDLLERSARPPITLLAFGPGLTMESVTLV